MKILYLLLIIYFVNGTFFKHLFHRPAKEPSSTTKFDDLDPAGKTSLIQHLVKGKKSLSLVNKDFYRETVLQSPRFVFDFNVVKKFRQWKCDILKVYRQTVIFKNYHIGEVPDEYLKCIQNIEGFEIDKFFPKKIPNFFQKNPAFRTLKKLSIKFHYGFFGNYIKEIFSALPKSLESLEFSISIFDLTKINSDEWNRYLEELPQLKHFKIELTQLSNVVYRYNVADLSIFEDKLFNIHKLNSIGLDLNFGQEQLDTFKDFYQKAKSHPDIQLDSTTLGLLFHKTEYNDERGNGNLL